MQPRHINEWKNNRLKQFLYSEKFRIAKQFDLNNGKQNMPFKYVNMCYMETKLKPVLYKNMQFRKEYNVVQLKTIWFNRYLNYHNLYAKPCTMPNQWWRWFAKKMCKYWCGNIVHQEFSWCKTISFFFYIFHILICTEFKHRLFWCYDKNRFSICHFIIPHVSSKIENVTITLQNVVPIHNFMCF